MRASNQVLITRCHVSQSESPVLHRPLPKAASSDDLLNQFMMGVRYGAPAGQWGRSRRTRRVPPLPARSRGSRGRIPPGFRPRLPTPGVPSETTGLRGCLTCGLRSARETLNAPDSGTFILLAVIW